MLHTSRSSVLLLLLSLAACRHPLVIEGEGDIMEVSGSGRGCTLEQFQGGHHACTHNEVEGPYSANYTAVPRAGWRFVGWKGYCAPGSEFQHCRYAIGAELIDWWEEMYPGTETAPLTAVFAPITGAKGQLIGTGTPVAGVSYSTERLCGQW